QRFYHEMSHALDLFTGGVECLGLNHHTACFDNHGPSIEPHVIQLQGVQASGSLYLQATPIKSSAALKSSFPLSTLDCHTSSAHLKNSPAVPLVWALRQAVTFRKKSMFTSSGSRRTLSPSSGRGGRRAPSSAGGAGRRTGRP